MKCLVLVALAALPVFAEETFDADAWEVRRAEMAKQAARMKAEYEVYSAKADAPAEDVTIPFETFDGGNIKSVVVAKRGQFFHDVGYVWARDISVEQFREDGTLDMRLEAENCLLNRSGKCCWVSGHVRAVHRKTTLEGDDAFYSSSNNFLKVMSNAKVVSEDVKMKGLKL